VDILFQGRKLETVCDELNELKRHLDWDAKKYGI
jgi:hypothetical protein